MKALVMSTLSVMVLASSAFANTNQSPDPALNPNAAAASEMTPPCQKMKRNGRRDFAQRADSETSAAKVTNTGRVSQ